MRPQKHFILKPFQSLKNGLGLEPRLLKHDFPIHAGISAVRSKIWPFSVAKRIATATVSLPPKDRLLESGQAFGHYLLTMKLSKKSLQTVLTA